MTICGSSELTTTATYAVGSDVPHDSPNPPAGSREMTTPFSGAPGYVIDVHASTISVRPVRSN